MSAEKTTVETGVKLRKSDLWKSFFIWEATAETSLSYERLMSLGFCHTMLPVIKRLYKDKQDQADAMTRHLAFFNTETHWGAMIPGIVASMEEKRANGADISDEVINSVKVGLMGPLAGIGDTITQGLMFTIFASIGVDLAMQGNIVGPFLFFLLYTAYMLGIAVFMYFQGYRLGTNALSMIKDQSIMRKLTNTLSILGLTVAGALVANYVSISTGFEITMGETVVTLQSLLDQIMPGLLSLLTVGVCTYFLKKNRSPLIIMAGLAVVGLIGSLFGIF